MKKVLTLCDQNGVSEFYRTLTPYRLLAEAGEIELEQSDGASPVWLDRVREFDVVVFSRSDSATHTALLLKCKQEGVKIAFDIDDNLFLLPPSIGPYDAWHERGTGRLMPRAAYLRHNIQQADVLTVSTRALGEQLTAGRPHRLREDFVVLENQILAADWTGIEPIEKPPGEIWVGWWGIYNHWDDWRDIAPYIEPVIVARPEARLVILGFPEVAHLFPTLRKTQQLMVAPFVPPGQLAEYRRYVKAFDIALAPTSECEFNRAKSDLKLLQYGAAGVPVIASAVTYGDWRHLARIVDRPYCWGEELDRALYERPDHGLLHERVMGLRTYERNFRRWLTVL